MKFAGRQLFERREISKTILVRSAQAQGDPEGLFVSGQTSKI
jgi:hypothetical protein